MIELSLTDFVGRIETHYNNPCDGMSSMDYRFTTRDGRVLDAVRTAERVRVPILAFSGAYQDVIVRNVRVNDFLRGQCAEFQVEAISTGPPVFADGRGTLAVKFDFPKIAWEPPPYVQAADRAERIARTELWRQQMMGKYVTVRPPARYLATDVQTGIAIRPVMKFDGRAFEKAFASFAAGADFAAKVNRYYEENCYIIKEKPLKIRNRFYVAAERVTSLNEQDQVNTPDKVHLADGIRRPVHNSNMGKWTRPTLKAAIAHAEQILEANPTQDHVAIVQIVRTVRRKKAPLVVETVK